VPAPDAPSTLIERLQSREAVIGVVGLGYVGLPVAIAFAEAGFRVAGVDTLPERIEALNAGRSYIDDVSEERIAAARKDGRLTASETFEALQTADAILISVPTPITNGTPDLTRIESAALSIADVLPSGSLVVLESTTYPGTTEELLRPILETGGLTAGADFLLAYSPERIDPGNPSYRFEDIPKIVGGIDEPSARAAETLYSQVVPKVVTVSGTREAEMAKLIENTFRHVNIALVNELALHAEEVGVDIWEAIEAAATKPFGFMPFWPSPGWGGHCIPVDPSYLSWRVKSKRAHDIRFIELAHNVNATMPRFVEQRIGLLLNEQGKAFKGSRILGIGLAYKGGTSDTRGSPAVEILRSLSALGAEVSYHDPLVQSHPIAETSLDSSPLTAETLRAADLVVAFVPQDDVDWGLIAREAKVVFDCCNALKDVRPQGRIVRL
jgi:UDP-N-acetyl-D-glucosamine dehydrogenase